MPKKCRVCGFDDGHNFKCPKKTPPSSSPSVQNSNSKMNLKPELKYVYTSCCAYCGEQTGDDGWCYKCKTTHSKQFPTPQSVDALIKWSKARLKEMRK
jgi:hypothetical protein